VGFATKAATSRRYATVVVALAVATACIAATAPAQPVRADSTSPLYELVDAAAQRLQTADPVAAYKWATSTAIEDQPRVQQVLAAVSADATANHVDAGYVRRVFEDQIDATESIEYTRFAQWKLDPRSAPTSPAGLSASRTAIDGLNRTMVTEIAGHWDLLHSPLCAAYIADAKDAVTGARQLDAVYQQALAFATRSYCG
jgi:chorismate mutase